MKKFLSLLMASAMMCSLVACGTKSTAGTEQTAEPSVQQTATDSDMAYLQESGKMVIGYTIYPPMNYTDDNGVFTGFDTELSTIVCEKLGLEPEFVLINWDTKEVALNAKDIDCIWNGMTLTPERQANMACTNPYGQNALAVVVREDFEYTDTSSLIGKVVCAEIGSCGEMEIIGSEDKPAEENLAQAEYVGKAAQIDCLMEVKSGTADAAVIDLALAKSLIGEGKSYTELEIVSSKAVENYGAAFRPGSDVRDAVNSIFEELKADGTMQELADKYEIALAE